MYCSLRIYFIYISILIGVVACSKKVQREYFDDGTLKIEAIVKNGKIHGLFREYNNDGILIYESNFINGNLDGIEKSYFDNGKIKSKVRYENGLREGECILYYENSNIKMDAITKNDTIIYYKKFGQDGKEIDVRRDINIYNKKDIYQVGDSFKARVKITGVLKNQEKIVVNCIVIKPDGSEHQVYLDVNNIGESDINYILKKEGNYNFSFYYFIENDIRQVHKKSKSVQVIEK